MGAKEMGRGVSSKDRHSGRDQAVRQGRGSGIKEAVQKETLFFPRFLSRKETPCFLRSPGTCLGSQLRGPTTPTVKCPCPQAPHFGV